MGGAYGSAPFLKPSARMYTVCPKCALTLVVTAADLRVAQGYVRCGRCSNVFNALVALTEERHPVPPPPPPPPPRREVFERPQRTRSKPEPDEVIPDSELEFNPTATDVSEIFVEPARDRIGEETGTFESIVLESSQPEEDAPATETRTADEPEGDEVEIDLHSLATQLEAEDKANAREPARTPQADEHAETAGARRPASPPASSTSATVAAPSQAKPQPAPSPAPTAVVTPSFERERRPVPVAWTIGTCVLALVLVVQIVHHFRHDLAADARLNRPLTSLYAALGAPLVPRWDLSTYEVRQLGASADPATPGVLTVRASIKNAADQPRPLPLLRVTVQDRFGNRIAMRDVPPEAYLPRAIPPSSLMSAGQRIDAEMAFVDPGEAAVGFEVDACLPAPGSAIACANDLAAR